MRSLLALTVLLLVSIHCLHGARATSPMSELAEADSALREFVLLRTEDTRLRAECGMVPESATVDTSMREVMELHEKHCKSGDVCCKVEIKGAQTHRFCPNTRRGAGKDAACMVAVCKKVGMLFSDVQSTPAGGSSLSSFADQNGVSAFWSTGFGKKNPKEKKKLWATKIMLKKVTLCEDANGHVSCASHKQCVPTTLMLYQHENHACNNCNFTDMKGVIELHREYHAKCASKEKREEGRVDSAVYGPYTECPLEISLNPKDWSWTGSPSDQIGCDLISCLLSLSQQPSPLWPDDSFSDLSSILPSDQCQDEAPVKVVKGGKVYPSRCSFYRQQTDLVWPIAMHEMWWSAVIA